MAEPSDCPSGDAVPAGDAPGSYRPEIDGLRAIAVIAVMLYHAEVPWLGGGYLGVDVFFAISGFLITGIIVRSSEAGRFSLGTFYVRRIRRIIPALAVMCLLTLPCAWLLMMPDDLENFGQSMVATALSANNVLLYLTSGYFAQAAHFKPLFHTWSLGVEEQYYAIAPLLLMLALRLGGRRGAFLLLALCTAASLIFCEWIRHTDDEANFLMLPSRLWELGLGGMTALAGPRLLNWLGHRGRLRQALVAAGLAMTISGLILLAPIENLPGWPVLLPLLGTCLVLALANTSGAGRLLGARPIAGLGLISYSAYLYHVPIYAMLRIASLEAPSPIQLVSTLPLCLLLAWLSWRFVERPWRDPARTSRRAVLLFSGAVLAAVVAAGLLLHATSGLFAQSALARHDQQLGYDQTAAYNEAPRAFADRPFPTNERARNVLVIGDSFARDFINMGLETGRLSGFAISYALVHNCDALAPAVLARIRSSTAVVFGSGIDNGELACMQQKLALLESLDVPHIVVLGTKHFGYNNNAVMLLPAATRYSYRAKPHDDAVAANRQARRAIPGKYYVDLLAVLDDGSGTVPVFTPERKFISQDRRHLTRAGARFMGEKVFAQPQFSWANAPED